MSHSVKLVFILGYVFGILGIASVLRAPFWLSIGCIGVAILVGSTTRKLYRKMGVVLPSSKLFSLLHVLGIVSVSLLILALVSECIGESMLNSITPHPVTFVSILYLIYCTVADLIFLSNLNMSEKGYLEKEHEAPRQ